MPADGSGSMRCCVFPSFIYSEAEDLSPTPLEKAGRGHGSGLRWAFLFIPCLAPAPRG